MTQPFRAKRRHGHGHVDRTVSAEHVATEMRIPYVFTGYRPMYKPVSYYVKSLFKWHNETVNVWTHLLGCLCILSCDLYYYTIYQDEDSVLRWTLVGHGLCCCLTLLNSATAHLLHSKSRRMNFMIFMFDYIGVVMWGYGTAILAIYGVSHELLYHKLIPFYLILQLVLGTIAYLVMCASKVRYGHDLHIKSRKHMIIAALIGPSSVNVIPWFQRYIDCYTTDSCAISSLNHITIVCVFFILVALSFVLHQPEKCYPGKFDCAGQSHQIFHVLVVITQVLQIRCLYIDYRNGANLHCQPILYDILTYIGLLYGCCGASLLYMCTHVDQTIAPKDKHQ